MSNLVTLEPAARRPSAAHPLLLPGLLLVVALGLGLLVLLPNLPAGGSAAAQQEDQPPLASLPISA